MLCPNCGYNNQANNRFCVRCGIDISAHPSPETPSFGAAPTDSPASVPTGPASPPGPGAPAPPSPWGTPFGQTPDAPSAPPPPPYGQAPYAPPPPPPPPYGGPPVADPANPFAPPPVYGVPGGYPPPGSGPYQPYGSQYPPGAYQVPSTNGLAIAALVLGLVGWIPCGVGSLAAIVFGFVARSQIRNSQGRQSGDGMALAGIILGFVAVGLWLLLVIVGAATGSGSGSN